VGFYFPIFYLQLDAVTHGIDETFAFYSVSGRHRLPPSIAAEIMIISARDHERL
jgi:hypothetical protein